MYLSKLELFKKDYYLKFPNNGVEILEYHNSKEVVTSVKYGKCLSMVGHLNRGKIPTIMSALDKNDFFKNQSIEINGDKYDYSRVNYINGKTEIELFCKIHDKWFFKTPMDILRKRGCNLCKQNNKNKTQPTLIDLNTFKNRFFSKHPNSDLKIVDYKNAYNVIVQHKYGLCNLQSSNLLLSGKCNIDSAINKTEFFINKVKHEHPNFLKYDYSLTNYTTNHSNIFVRCIEHNHIFETLPSNHYISNCPLCSNETKGWEWTKWKERGEKSRYFDSFKLYVIRCWNNEEKFYKIGKTFTTVKRRFTTKKEDMPYNYEIVKEIISDAYTICKLEMLNHKQFKEYRYIPKIKFGGSRHECFSFIDIDKIITEL